MGGAFFAVLVVLLILKLTGVAAELSWWWVASPVLVYVAILVILFTFVKVVFFPSRPLQAIKDFLGRMF